MNDATSTEERYSKKVADCQVRVTKKLDASEIFGTIHLRRRQIFTIFDPFPPTIGIPAKCL